jgi:cytochrome c
VRRPLVFALTFAAAAAFSVAAHADPVGNAEKGKSVFRQCSVCHSAKKGENRVGPSLAGIIGEKAGEVPGFNFSKAMKESGIVWNDKTLDEYLEHPQKVVKGTRMAFPGLKKAQDRADVIAYLKTLK